MTAAQPPAPNLDEAVERARARIAALSPQEGK
jgi:hypothetical protein